MDEVRASHGEARRNVSTLTERVQSLQGELNLSEMRREELEAELSNAQEVKICSDETFSTGPTSQKAAAASTVPLDAAVYVPLSGSASALRRPGGGSAQRPVGSDRAGGCGGETAWAAASGRHAGDGEEGR